MTIPTPDMVVAKFVQDSLGPVILNVVRGRLVETMVKMALRDTGWRQCVPWQKSYDFEQDNTSLRLQVKSSCARIPKGVVRAATFDTSKRHLTDLYVFAYHPGIDEKTTDHRDPEQWEFHVMPTDGLPHRNRITLAEVRTLARAVGYADLAQQLALVAAAE